MTLNIARKKWLAQGIASFLFFGAGVAVVFDAAFRRMTESHWELWAAEGGVGLFLMMVGLVFFGSSVRYMVHMDRIVEYSDRRARSRARKERKFTEIQLRRSEGSHLKPVRMGAQ